MENDVDERDEIVLLINSMEEGKLDRMLLILHNATDNSDYIDEEN